MMAELQDEAETKEGEAQRAVSAAAISRDHTAAAESSAVRALQITVREQVPPLPLDGLRGAFSVCLWRALVALPQTAYCRVWYHTLP